MAKKQTFGDKTSKASTQNRKYVKVIRSTRGKDTNSLKFNELMLAVKGDKNIDAAVKEFFNK
jgi:hypothetical protein|tara:strand:- start:228 stop:413 length:186 start_codon:yes stop_codon:yes gene_type:complete